MSLLHSATPWEKHLCRWPNGSFYAHVRREDLCAAVPGSPDFSKLRGIEEHLRRTRPGRIGVLDSIHSKAGWGVSWVASHLGIPVELYYPVTVKEGGIAAGPVRPFQKKAQELGANLHPMPAGMSAVLWHQARADFMRTFPTSDWAPAEFLPNGLQFAEAVEATCQQVLTDEGGQAAGLYRPGTMWVVSASSGNIASGVLKGLALMGFQGTLVVHMGYSRSAESLRTRIHERAGVWQGAVNVVLVDEGWDYAQDAPGWAPFPCNPYYDLKAWNWLASDKSLPLRRECPADRVAFWNIGA